MRLHCANCSIVYTIAYLHLTAVAEVVAVIIVSSDSALYLFDGLRARWAAAKMINKNVKRAKIQ